ncbi:MAG: hypothetical protein GF330_03445 [Candidatus Eisenbacteria bacterium]|nr:hypothetical protein [Candidatus Eisenbacteria bacterium]
MARSFTLRLEGATYEIQRRGRAIYVNGNRFEPKVTPEGVVIGDSTHRIEIAGDRAFVDGIGYAIETEGLEQKKRTGVGGPGAAAVDAPGALTAIMPGMILKVLAGEGDQVAAGDVVIILEAMKMENEICAPKDGVVQEIRVKEGENVQQNQVLAIVE